MERRGRCGVVWTASVAAAILMASPCSAYYHYVHYLTSGAPYTQVPEKFDLNSLPNKTVTFFVNDTGPAVLGQNDSFASVLSQVQQAAAAWNASTAATSDLRVAFGGLEAQNQPSNTPGGDVIFIDLPPGVLGQGAPTTSLTPVNGPNGTFFPVLHSTVWLTNNTSLPPGPSYLETFFTTTVHEMGHAMGLQHTFTGSAMSQGVIRNTWRTRPVDADDVASLSLLYPKAGYSATVGSISGRVTSNGQSVALASVVALTASGPAVSTLTNPDGTYRIDGLAPNNYFVYVHPLPPDADIKGPFDANGQQIPASGPFETLFYGGPGAPGTRDPSQFGVVSVTRGGVSTGIDFSVQPRSAVPMYDVVTYSYLGPSQTPVTPAFVNSSQSAMATVVARSLPPLVTPVPQSVTILGGFGNVLIQPYGSPLALGLYFSLPLFAGTGPRHMLFNLGNDMYVLPDAINLTQQGPPVISSVTPVGDGTYTVTGSNFAQDSLVFFDGLPATVATPFSGDSNQASITVTPPPGFSSQNATVTVFNSDGQNSMFLQSQNPFTVAYNSAPAPQITVNPSSLPAGASAMVDITAANMQFIDGKVTVGFGNHDVAIRRVWVLSPTHLVANVTVAPGALLGASEISVISGFQIATQPFAFQTQSTNASLPMIALPIVNALPVQQTIFPGGYATIYGTNLSAPPGTVQVTLNGQPVQVQFAGSSQINFLVPQGFPTGPAALNVFNGSVNALPVMVQIDSAPPAITAVTNMAGQPVDATHAAGQGDTLNVLVTGLDPAAAANPAGVEVVIAGVSMPVQTITAESGGVYQIQFLVTQSWAGAPVPLSVAVNGSTSTAVTVSIR
ncbi:MAG TPA: IPT/TIG domain-containing protein [Bryobacteraceae bacterium]|nr:IPT/TIG domain-containing protein [Bryobacteraceae bacterium]